MDQQNRKINKRSQIEQQMQNFQQQYQKWQNKVFQGVNIASEKNLYQEYNHFQKKITYFLEQNYQKDIQNLDGDNEKVKNQLYKLNTKLQNFVKKSLSQMLINFDKKKLQTGNFQKFYKNLSTYLISTQDRSYIPSLYQIPKNFIIVPKITFTAIIHAIKSTNLNSYINYSVYYQYNRLMQYLAKTRYQNYQNLSEKIKKQIGNENIQQIISKIYYTHSNFLKKDFTRIQYETYSFETMYQFSASTKQTQLIQIHSALLQQFSFKKSLFNHVQQQQWNGQQYQQLKQLIQFFDSFFKTNSNKFKQKQQVYRRIMNALIKLNQNLNITANQQIQYKKSQINQKFYRLRQLSKKFYFHHQKLEFQTQKLKLLQQINSQQIQESSIIIKNLCQIMTVGIMAKTVQYNNIAIKLRQSVGQSVIFQMQIYKWKVFLQFQIKTQDQNSTFIRLKGQIQIPQRKLLNIKKKNVEYIPQLLEKLTQQLYVQFIFQIIQKNGFYVQLWFEEIAELKITKFQAMSPSIIPLTFSSNFSLFNHFWFANFIYNTSSLQNYFWKSQKSIHVSFRKIWTVYAKGFISNYQKFNNIDLSQFNCYQQAIIVLNSQLGNPLQKDQQQTNRQFMMRMKQFENIRQIIINQDAYNLVNIFNINVFFDDEQFSHLNITCSDTPLHLMIYSCHAQLSYDLPQYLNKEKQNKRKIFNVSQFSLQMVKGQVKPAKTIKNNLLQQLKFDYQQFKSNKIQTQFGYFDLQTYACKDQIMQIYLSVLVCFVPQSVCIQMNKHLQITQQTFLGWVKVHIILTQQCVLFQWFGKKCSSIAELTAWIMVSLSDLHYVSFKKPITWWTFNGLGFDYSYILNSLIKFTNYLWSFGVGRECKGMKNKYLVLQDARNFFPIGTLKKLTWQNNLKYKKKNVKIQLITNFSQFNQNRDLIIDYCIYDCLSLQQLIVGFYKNLYSMTINSFIQYRKQQIKNNVRLYDNISLDNIIKRPTASNFALYFFKMVFLKESYKIFDSKQQIEQQKLSFSGGMVQVIQHFPHNQKVFQGDANSMYPSNMKYLPIWPYQDKFWQQVNTSQQIKKRFINDVNNKKWLRQFLFEKQLLLFQQNNKNYFQQQQQRQKTHENFYNALTNRYLIRYVNYHHKILPFISKRNKNSLFYNNQVNAYRWVSGFAILHLLTHGCQVVIQKVRCRSVFKLGKYDNPFYVFASLCYNQRLIYKKNKQNGLADCFKLMLNSLYGKFLQQLFSKIKMYSSEFQNSQYKKILKYADQFFYTQCQQQNYKFSGDLITIASSITQLSRIKVSQLVFMLGQKNCFYTDTDSLYFNSVGKSIFEKLTLQFYVRQWGCQQGFKEKSISGKQLGQWKIQNPLSPFKSGVFISRKCLLLQTDQIQTQNKEIININDQQKLKSMFISQNEGNQMFQFDQKQFYKWKREKYTKIRLKGINIKPNFQETDLIIKIAKKTYQQQVKIPNFSQQYGIFSSLQIPLKFSTQQWKRQFYKVNSGVKIIDQIKRISFNFKRFPKIGGGTKAFQTFDVIFAGFQK